MLKIIFLAFFALTGCQSLGLWPNQKTDPDAVATEDSADEIESSDNKKSEPIKSSPSQRPVKTSANSSLEEMAHKQALMWARISDLEDQLKEEKAKVELLQKKQRTGLDFKPKRRVLSEDDQIFSPEKRNVENETSEKQKKIETKAISENLPEDYSRIEKSIASESVENEEKKNLKNKADEKRNQAIAKAQDLYRTGSFGASVVELEKAIKDFGDSNDGVCAFWIARNWMSLKEFQTAVTKFEEFGKRFAQSSYLARSKLELARAQNQLGMRSKALHSYQEIISKYPGQDSAEMAQLEIEKLKRTL